MKRLLLLLLALTLTVGMFGCAKEEEGATEPAKDAVTPPEGFEITFCVPVATGVCIVGGLCTAECESLKVSDPAGNETKILPDKNESAGYFFGQVKITEDCTLSVQECYSDGTASAQVQVSADYREMENLMTGDEYMPVFGNDSRMHFYSAILTYTLSDFVYDSIMTQTEKNITDSVKKLEAVNPDAELIYLVVPSSASVYPEGVPAEYPAAQGQTLKDAFQMIATECGATVIDPLDAFLEHRDDGAGYKIYHNTDSHWTAYGAYLGVSEMMKHIAKEYPAAAPRSVEDMGFYTTELWGGDALFSFGDGSGFEDFSKTGRTGKTEITKISELTTMFSRKMPTSTLNSVYRGGKSTYVNGDSNSGEATVKNPDADGLPSAVILRDSFACPAYDIVNDRFSTVWWQSSHNYGYPKRAVEEHEPDYVIYLVSERNLLKVMLENANASISSFAN